MFLHIQTEKELVESHNINAIRAHVSPNINLITENFSNLSTDDITNSLQDINSKALIADINGNVLYNNSSLSETNITHELYQDNSYSTRFEDMIKISFPITIDSSVVGFVIYEIPEVEFISANYLLYNAFIILEIILVTALIALLVISYRKTIIKPVQKLERALIDVSNGIYNKLLTEDGLVKKSFTNYNIMLEEIENNLNNQANYAKSRKQLIANISHEIRTPLSYVKMSAEILDQNQEIDEEGKKYINTILQKITLIDGIIEDLFRFSRQDMDKLLIELKETYAKDMFQRIFNRIKQKDKSKEIDITIDNQIPNILISVDENRIEQVISNMVDNAEKHIIKKGFISIKTEITDNHIVLTIEDSGEGILAKDLPYIFEPFYQGSQDDETKRKGAGLGLSICDYIINKHNGEIFVYSEKDKGTKFAVKFPEIM